MNDLSEPVILPIVGIDDLRACGFEQFIDTNSNDTLQYCQNFSQGAKEALEKGNEVKANTLELLSCVCSLQLNASYYKNPFIPCVVFKDGTTSIKWSDFTKEQAQILFRFFGKCF